MALDAESRIRAMCKQGGWAIFFKNLPELVPIRGLAFAPLAATVLAASPALADATDPPGAVTLSGNVQVVSDYRFRGISRSGGDFAVQGRLDVDHASGVYAGVWASSMNDAPFQGDAEVNLYGGWSGEIGSGIRADAGLRYYLFPDADGGDTDFFEPYASLTATLGPASARLGVAYAWDQSALGGDDNLYVYTDLDAGIPNTPVSVAAHLGYSDGALSPERRTGAGSGGGFDWSLGASYALTRNLAVGASYVGAEGRSIASLSNDTLVGTLKFSF
jgi:uncharacterized protein (TIGR02001 family)